MKNKLVVAVLGLLLILSMLPTTALADGSDGSYAWTDLSDTTVEITSVIGDPSGNITLPDTLGGKAVVGIAANACSGKTLLTGVTIPEGVTYIGNSAFSGCTLLASVSLPNSLERIDGAAFKNDIALLAVTMQNNVTIIGSEVFEGCTSLNSATLSDKLKKVSMDTFRLCTSLHTITIPSSVTEIGTHAFDSSGLTSIDIPGSVTGIGVHAFVNCVHLSSVTLHNGLLYIYSYAFFMTPVTQITIPSTVISIQGYVCDHLAKVTVLGETTSFNSDAFGLSSLSDGVYGFAGSTAAAFASAKGYTFHTLHKVLFDSKGGSAVDFGYAILNDTIAAPVAPTLTGYGFGGWHTDEACTAAATFPYTVTGNGTLFAKWAGNNYTVAYDANGGSGTMASTSHVYDASKQLRANSFTRENYLFDGWAALAGGPAVYTDEQSVSNLTTTNGATVTLYATWKADPALTSSVTDGKIYTGGRITLTPNIDGGTWDWDTTFFSATFNSPATFTALKAGTSTITYTAEGQSVSYEVTITKAALPDTGQDFAWVIGLGALAVFIGIAAVAAHRQKPQAHTR